MPGRFNANGAGFGARVEKFAPRSASLGDIKDQLTNAIESVWSNVGKIASTVERKMSGGTYSNDDEQSNGLNQTLSDSPFSAFKVIFQSMYPSSDQAKAACTKPFEEEDSDDSLGRAIDFYVEQYKNAQRDSSESNSQPNEKTEEIKKKTCSDDKSCKRNSSGKTSQYIVRASSDITSNRTAWVLGKYTKRRSLTPSKQYQEVSNITKRIGKCRNRSKSITDTQNAVINSRPTLRRSKTYDDMKRFFTLCRSRQGSDVINDNHPMSSSPESSIKPAIDSQRCRSNTMDSPRSLRSTKVNKRGSIFHNPAKYIRRQSSAASLLRMLMPRTATSRNTSRSKSTEGINRLTGGPPVLRKSKTSEDLKKLLTLCTPGRKSCPSDGIYRMSSSTSSSSSCSSTGSMTWEHRLGLAIDCHDELLSPRRPRCFTMDSPTTLLFRSKPTPRSDSNMSCGGFPSFDEDDLEDYACDVPDDVSTINMSVRFQTNAKRIDIILHNLDNLYAVLGNNQEKRCYVKVSVLKENGTKLREFTKPVAVESKIDLQTEFAFNDVTLDNVQAITVSVHTECKRPLAGLRSGRRCAETMVRMDLLSDDKQMNFTGELRRYNSQQ